MQPIRLPFYPVSQPRQGLGLLYQVNGDLSIFIEIRRKFPDLTELIREIIIETERGAAISGQPQGLRCLISRRPSPCRVAVVLFDTDGHGESANMERNRYRHLIHLLSEDVADPPTVLSSAPAPSGAGIYCIRRIGICQIFCFQFIHRHGLQIIPSMLY